jgi:hypothetical protein
VKVVYGNPKTIMTIGMVLLGDIPTPFMGFVDKIKVEADPAFAFGSNAAAMIEKIDELGGVIIYVENPDAASRLHEMLNVLFNSATETPWGDIEETEVGLQ